MFSLDEPTWRPARATTPNRDIKFGQVYDLDCEASLCIGPLWQCGRGNCFVSYCPDGSNSDVALGAWQEFHPDKADHNAMQIDAESESKLLLVTAHRRN